MVSTYSFHARYISAYLICIKLNNFDVLSKVVGYRQLQLYKEEEPSVSVARTVIKAQIISCPI